jgi:hypothetical protein
MGIFLTCCIPPANLHALEKPTLSTSQTDPSFRWLDPNVFEMQTSTFVRRSQQGEWLFYAETMEQAENALVKANTPLLNYKPSSWKLSSSDPKALGVVVDALRADLEVS